MQRERDIKAAVRLETEVRSSGRRVAVLVGVNGDPTGRGLSKLEFAQADAQAIAARLEACGFEVIVLCGPEATRDRINEALAMARQGAGGDLFVFFFAGHGQFHKNSYLLYPHDSGSTGSNALVYDLLCREWDEGFPFAKVLVVLDACRTSGRGGVADRACALTSETAGHIRAATTGLNRCIEVLFGCSEGQAGYEDPDLRHGVFTHALLQAFEKFKDYLTTHTLAGAANGTMLAWSEQDPHSRHQQAQRYDVPNLKAIELVNRSPGFAELSSRLAPGLAARQQVRSFTIPNLPRNES